MGRADFELANLELIQRNSTEETKIVWQTRVPQKVDPASIARFRSAVRGEYADTKLLIYGLFQKGQVLAQNGVRDLSLAGWRIYLEYERWRVNWCLRCLLLVMCTHPFAKKALTRHLARSEGHERYFGCNLMHRKVLASSHQHLMTEAPR